MQKQRRKWDQKKKDKIMRMRDGGLTYMQIAEEMGCNYSTIRNLIYKEDVRREDDSVAKTIRVLRSLRQMTQLELSRRTGIKQVYMSWIETSKARLSDKNRKRICKALKIKVEDFIAIARKTKMCKNSILGRISG